MVETSQLIKDLSAQAKPVTPMRLRRYAAGAAVALSVYAVCAQCWLEGFRPDFTAQLMRPMFILELLLLTAMLVSAAVAAVVAMLPDAAQQRLLMRAPYFFSGAMLALVTFQLLLPQDARMVMAHAAAHTHQCTMYIAVTALLPAMAMFMLLRKGASVMPTHAGALAVIASVAVGAITLRLAEANDSITHLLTWHYIPSIFFASMGALLGRALLRW